MTDGRDLYLELLIKAVSGTLWRDPSIYPETAGIYDPALRHAGADWPAVAHTMIGTQRLQNVRTLATRVLQEGIPGDFIETGAWRGGACILMRGVLKAMGDTLRRVYVADSFQGVPPPDAALYPADQGSGFHTHRELAVSRAEVEANFAAYDLLDTQIVFVEGWFRDTLPALRGHPFALLRLDGDLYQSTIEALDCLYPGLSPGGFVIVDDYQAIANCRQAVEDFRRAHDIQSPIHRIDSTGIWWQRE